MTILDQLLIVRKIQNQRAEIAEKKEQKIFLQSIKECWEARQGVDTYQKYLVHREHVMFEKISKRAVELRAVEEFQFEIGKLHLRRRELSDLLAHAEQIRKQQQQILEAAQLELKKTVRKMEKAVVSRQLHLKNMSENYERSMDAEMDEAAQNGHELRRNQRLENPHV